MGCCTACVIVASLALAMHLSYELATVKGVLSGRPPDAGGFQGLSKAAGKFVHIGPRGSYAQLSWGRTYYVWLRHSRAELDWPLVVLLHGGCGECSVFMSPNRSRYGEALFESGYNVLCLDFYGHGFSDGPDLKEYSAELYASQLAELLFFLQLRTPVDLVAHSVGGAVAAVFAARFPHRVRRLVLQAPMVMSPSVPAPLAAALRVTVGHPWLFNLLARPVVMEDMGEGANADNTATLRMAQRLMETAWRSRTPNTLFLHDKRRDCVELLASLPSGLPVHLLGGNEDTEMPLESMQELRRRLPGREASLDVVPGATHMSFADGPLSAEHGRRFRVLLMMRLPPLFECVSDAGSLSICGNASSLSFERATSLPSLTCDATA